VPSNSSAGAAAPVEPWGQACGAKHETSARKRMSMGVRTMALDSAKGLFFNGHHSNQIAADMVQSFVKPAGTVTLFFGNFTHDFHGFSATDLPASGEQRVDQSDGRRIGSAKRSGLNAD